MDPRIGWCTPEQLGPAHRHWLRLWEASNSFHKSDIIMINNANPNNLANLERQQDFIPLEINQLDLQQNDLNKSRYGKENIHKKGNGGNKASTYGLNHSSNLEILERNRLVPWLKPGKSYDGYLTSNIMWYVRHFSSQRRTVVLLTESVEVE